MKRLILSLFVVLLGATSVMGQGYTADWVVKSSNELLYKVSERGNVIRMELPKKDGGVMPMLMFGKDSLCLLMPETKSYAVFTGEKMRGKTKELLGFELESISNTTEKTFRGEEVISGVSCQLQVAPSTVITYDLYTQLSGLSSSFKRLLNESRVTPGTVTAVPQPYASAQPPVETPVTAPVTEAAAEPASEPLAESESAPTPAPAEESVKPRFCSECGTPLKAGMAFCGNCGKKVG